MQKRGEASSTWIRLGGQLAVCLTVLTTGGAGPAMAIDLSVGPTRQNAPSGHVAELRDYLGKLRIADPIWYRPLAVYPLLPVAGVDLAGAWLTLDAAIAQGNLVVREKGEGGSVPVVLVENHSRNQHVFILAGEVLGGGKQTRTVRRDVILAPGQRVELEVFCVEAHRWSGEVRFSPASTLVPQSLQKELRRGTDQQRIWSEVARNNRALAAENPTGSLELALKARPVREKLVAVRRHILPEIPHAAVGFIFVKGSRALGGELFGDSQLARGLLPKLLDSYAVDCVLQSDSSGQRRPEIDRGGAEQFFRRICDAGSWRTDTPGSGAGIRTRRAGLLGEGVSLGGVLVHYGVQIEERIIPAPGRLLPSPRQRVMPLPRN